MLQSGHRATEPRISLKLSLTFSLDHYQGHHGCSLRRTRAGKAASDVSERCASPAPIFTW